MAETFQLPPTEIEEFTLANGLRVVFSPDRAIPVVSIAVYYDVGSRNEREGRTGFAHLFERVSQKLTEIERLRAELRGLIADRTV